MCWLLVYMQEGNKIRTALVIGATSDVGRAIAHCLAGDGYALQLAGRDPVPLERDAGPPGAHGVAV